jgi:hypothetical protein
MTEQSTDPDAPCSCNADPGLYPLCHAAEHNEVHESNGRHPKDPDLTDPGFCRCGLGLEAWVHTDTARYREVPLSSIRGWGSEERQS